MSSGRLLTLEARGLDNLEAFFRTAGDAADKAMPLSIREAARYGRALGSRQIRSQVNFSQSYLNSDGRLEVINVGPSMSVIRARNRATSLARFATSGPTFGRGRRGVRVRVSASGGGKTLDRGFFVRLRRGNSESGNVGLAVRSKNGPPSRGAVPIFKGAYLLYGPSVGQVAFDVFPAIEPDVSERLQNEFIRQFERFTRG